MIYGDHAYISDNYLPFVIFGQENSTSAQIFIDEKIIGDTTSWPLTIIYHEATGTSPVMTVDDSVDMNETVSINPVQSRAVGRAINATRAELIDKIDSLTASDVGAVTSEDITNAINALDKSDTAVGGQYVSAVSETDGVITVSRANLPTIDTALSSTSTNAV